MAQLLSSLLSVLFPQYATNLVVVPSALHFSFEDEEGDDFGGDDDDLLIKGDDDEEDDDVWFPGDDENGDDEFGNDEDFNY